MSITSVLHDTKARLDGLLEYANETTGQSDVSIGDAIKTLADGYGGGGTSYFNNVYAYGNCTARANLIVRQTPLYISLPVYSMAMVERKEITMSKPARPLIQGYVFLKGNDSSITNVHGVAGEVVANGTAQQYYGNALQHHGNLNGQQIVKLLLPGQAVTTPSDGYVLNIVITSPNTNGKETTFKTDNINLGNITPDTWIDVGNVGKLYIGWTDPLA